MMPKEIDFDRRETIDTDFLWSFFENVSTPLLKRGRHYHGEPPQELNFHQTVLVAYNVPKKCYYLYVFDHDCFTNNVSGIVYGEGDHRDRVTTYRLDKNASGKGSLKKISHSHRAIERLAHPQANVLEQELLYQNRIIQKTPHLKPSTPVILGNHGYRVRNAVPGKNLQHILADMKKKPELWTTKQRLALCIELIKSYDQQVEQCDITHSGLSPKCFKVDVDVLATDAPKLNCNIIHYTGSHLVDEPDYHDFPRDWTYLAPELFDKEVHINNGIYSLAVICIEVMGGEIKHPETDFNSETIAALLTKLEVNSPVKETFQNLLQQMLDLDPDERPSSQSILQTIQPPSEAIKESPVPKLPPFKATKHGRMFTPGSAKSPSHKQAKSDSQNAENDPAPPQFKKSS